MEIHVRPATERDLDAIERLYTDLNEYLEVHENHPKWRKGSYPLRCHAEEGLADGTLYVAEKDGEIAGTVIYLREQGEPYKTVQWQLPFDVPVVVLHILAVHPAHQGAGVGKALMDHAEIVARQRGAQAVRLDTYVDNLPVSKLYEKCGYSLCGLVDLGVEEIYGLKWYRAYEKVLKNALEES